MNFPHGRSAPASGGAVHHPVLLAMPGRIVGISFAPGAILFQLPVPVAPIRKSIQLPVVLQVRQPQVARPLTLPLGVGRMALPRPGIDAVAIRFTVAAKVLPGARGVFSAAFARLRVNPVPICRRPLSRLWGVSRFLSAKIVRVGFARASAPFSDPCPYAGAARRLQPPSARLSLAELGNWKNFLALRAFLLVGRA